MPSKVKTPWGWYRVVAEGASWKVKLLSLQPRRRTSLQRHASREEHWLILEGEVLAETPERLTNAETGVRRLVAGREGMTDPLWVPRHYLHRLTGGPHGGLLLELQVGNPCREEDIERIDDDYGRC